MARTKWTKETPAADGWYWMKYRGAAGGTVVCPGRVVHLKHGCVMVQSAYNDSFVEGPNHGGPGLKHAGKLDRSIRFGPEIPTP